MLNTSLAYDPYIDARKSDLRVVFKLVDLTAFSDAIATASISEAFSQLAQTHDENIYITDKLATLETDGWILDGTFKLPYDDNTGKQTGWWSGLSGVTGDFVSPPTVTFTFTGDHSSIGFTLFFDDKAVWYPKEFKVSVYNAANALIDELIVTCLGVSQFVDMPVDNYRKVIITFNSTHQAYQRVRLAEVVFGNYQYFDKTNIKEGNLTQEISPIAENLPSNYLEITIDNSDHKYNMINPDSLYAYLTQFQPISAEIGINDEYINAGTFYFAKSTAEDSSLTAQITAFDLFYQLEKSICKIGTTGTWTVAAAAAAVITDCGLSIATDIPALVGARTIGKAIPQNTTHREALRLIAQAGESTCYFDRAGVLTFVEMVEGASVDILDNDNMKTVAKISITDRINTINLTVKDEYAATETIYTAASVGAKETAQVLSVNNPLGTQLTADWLLVMAQHRIIYELNERGNPARELTDTVQVYDAYSENALMVVTKQVFGFDGALSATTKGVK